MDALLSLPPPPDGDQDRGGRVMVAYWTVFSVAIIVTGLRFWARIRIRAVGWDDWLMLAAVVSNRLPTTSHEGHNLFMLPVSTSGAHGDRQVFGLNRRLPPYLLHCRRLWCRTTHLNPKDLLHLSTFCYYGHRYRTSLRRCFSPPTYGHKLLANSFFMVHHIFHDPHQRSKLDYALHSVQPLGSVVGLHHNHCKLLESCHHDRCDHFQLQYVPK